MKMELNGVRLIEDLKSKLNGARRQLTHLRTRSGDLTDYVEDYVLPKLNTTTKRDCAEKVESVKKLLR